MQAVGIWPFFKRVLFFCYDVLNIDMNYSLLQVIIMQCIQHGCMCIYSITMYTIHMLFLKLDQESSDLDSDDGSEDGHDGGGITVSNLLITTTNCSVFDCFTDSTSSKTSLFLHSRTWIRSPLTTGLKMHMIVMTLQ